MAQQSNQILVIAASIGGEQVDANSTMEFTFIVSGARAGDVVGVNALSFDVLAPMNIVGCRVVEPGIIGITFANVTGSDIALGIQPCQFVCISP